MNKVLAIFTVLALAAGGGVSRYRQAAQRAQIQDVRKSLADHAARVDLSIHSSSGAGLQQIDAVLQRVREESKHRIAWVQVRDRDGALRGHAGMTASASFPLEFVRSQLRNRRPVFAVTQTEAGPVLLEVFAVRLPVESREARFLTVSDESNQFGFIEIAAHIDGPAQTPIQPQKTIQTNFL